MSHESCSYYPPNRPEFKEAGKTNYDEHVLRLTFEVVRHMFSIISSPSKRYILKTALDIMSTEWGLDYLFLNYLGRGEFDPMMYYENGIIPLNRIEKEIEKETLLNFINEIQNLRNLKVDINTPVMPEELQEHIYAQTRSFTPPVPLRRQARIPLFRRGENQANLIIRGERKEDAEDKSPEMLQPSPPIRRKKIITSGVIKLGTKLFGIKPNTEPTEKVSKHPKILTIGDMKEGSQDPPQVIESDTSPESVTTEVSYEQLMSISDEEAPNQFDTCDESEEVTPLIPENQHHITEEPHQE